MMHTIPKAPYHHDYGSEDDDKSDGRSSLFSTGVSSKSTQTRSAEQNHSRSSNEKNDFESSLANQGKCQVDLLRYVVITILLSSSVGVSVIVFLLTRNSEQQQFDAQYYGAAEKITTSIGALIDKIGVMNSVGISATIMARNEEQNTTAWPFVTFPMFEHRVASAKESSGALFMAFQPIVSDQDRDEWESYSVTKGTKWM
jgi:hypothetical protein